MREVTELEDPGCPECGRFGSNHYKPCSLDPGYRPSSSEQFAALRPAQKEANIRSAVAASQEYAMISGFYAGKVAKRSGVPYINHINDGLKILALLDATLEARLAFCIHPLVQGNDSLADFDPTGIGGKVLVDAMEYRNAANRYLAHHCGMEGRGALPSPLEDVNQMLRADKIQNRRDFEVYNEDHPNSGLLISYFWEWLERLGIAEEHYQEIIEKIYG